MEIADVAIRKEEYLKVLDKVETLIKVGVDANIIEPYDVSYLRNRIKKLRKADDYKIFIVSEDYKEFRELLRVCGMVCCKVVVSANSLVMEYQCSLCPIYAFERDNM